MQGGTADAGKALPASEAPGSPVLPAPVRKSERRGLYRIGQLAAIVLLAVLAYANSFPGGFILDDHTVVQLNPLVADPDFGRIFSTDYWGEQANTGLYRPLTILSFALNQALLGNTPFSYHLVNVLLHLLVSLMVFVVLKRLNRSASIAWLAAALFAVHPLHTEVLNQAVGRSELLAALFLLIGLWAGTRPWPRPAFANLLVVASYVLAALSKEHAIIFLALLPLTELTCGRIGAGGWRRRIGLYASLLAVTAAWLAWRTLGVVHTVARAVTQPDVNPLEVMEFVPRVLTALKIQGLYLQKLFWPAGLQGVYSGPNWLTPVTRPLSVEGLLIVAAFGGILILVVLGCRRNLPEGWAGAAYLVSFAATTNLFLVIGVAMAERLAYFPSIWFCLLVAALIARVNPPALRALIGALLIGGLAMATLARNPAFANEFTYWQADTTRDPGNILAWLSLADAYQGNGQAAEAERYFRARLADNPDQPELLSVYAQILLESGRYEDALTFALRAEAVPGVDVLSNKFVLARSYLHLGQYQEALRWLEHSRRYGPYGVYWEVRGMILEGLNRVEEAIESYRRVTRFSPLSEVPFRLGRLLLLRENYPEAERYLQLAVTYRDEGEIWNNLGIALMMQGKGGEGRDAFLRAAELAPDSAKFRDNYERAVRGAAEK